MGRQDKIRLPSGMGGLTRYFDEYQSRFQIAPGHVIVLALILGLLIVLLHYVGSSWIGGSP